MNRLIVVFTCFLAFIIAVDSRKLFKYIIYYYFYQTEIYYNSYCVY